MSRCIVELVSFRHWPDRRAGRARPSHTIPTTNDIKQPNPQQSKELYIPSPPPLPSITHCNMHYPFPFTSFTALTGAAILPALSSAQLVAVIHEDANPSVKAKNDKGTIPSARGFRKVKGGTECFLDKFYQRIEPRLKGMDTGILRCGSDEVCIEDDASSLGGRCQKEELTTENHRHLTACTYGDGTAGTKCVGTEACRGIDPNSVGCGSW